MARPRRGARGCRARPRRPCHSTGRPPARCPARPAASRTRRVATRLGRPTGAAAPRPAGAPRVRPGQVDHGVGPSQGAVQARPARRRRRPGRACRYSTPAVIGPPGQQVDRHQAGHRRIAGQQSDDPLPEQSPDVPVTTTVLTALPCPYERARSIRTGGPSRGSAAQPGPAADDRRDRSTGRSAGSWPSGPRPRANRRTIPTRSPGSGSRSCSGSPTCTSATPPGCRPRRPAACSSARAGDPVRVGHAHPRRLAAAARAAGDVARPAGSRAGGTGRRCRSDPMSKLLGNLPQAMAPLLFGMQAGSMVGHLASRAMGQYDLPVPRPPSDELLFVSVDHRRASPRTGACRPTTSGCGCASTRSPTTPCSAGPHVRARLDELMSAYAGSFQADTGAARGPPRRRSTRPTWPSLQETFSDPEVLLGELETPAQRAAHDAPPGPALRRGRLRRPRHGHGRPPASSARTVRSPRPCTGAVSKTARAPVSSPACSASS